MQASPRGRGDRAKPLNHHRTAPQTVRAIFTTICSSTLMTLGVVAAIAAFVATVAVKGFELTAFGALALYFVLWWTFLFAILPLGNQPETEPERMVPGQDPGAPAAPRLREKALLTSVIAAGVFFIAVLVFPLARL